MKNIIFLLLLLSLPGASMVFAEATGYDGHDDKEKLEFDDFSGIKIDEEEHAVHSDHANEQDGHKAKEQDHADHGDEKRTDGHDAHGEEAASYAELSEVQLRMAGVETLVVKQQSLGEAITAPGEVALNAYRTIKVTPRISAQVMQRHVSLGDRVNKGQQLVTLSSVEMAEAQGALMEANAEQRRVKKLGRQVVSEKRFVTAQISYQQAYARVSAYGMTKKQINSLIKTGNAAKATGEFVLLSSQDGTVINDDFVVGELLEPGHVLMVVSDESQLWVEARLAPENAARINIGAPASVQVGQHKLSGKVIQARHTLDEATRTLALYVEVANPNDELHPGQFVTVIIEGKDKQQGIVVPLAAVLRSPDGDWQVLVESSPDRFEPKEVEVLRTVGDKMLIQGIAPGVSIVGKDAFFVQSEIAKSGFSVHNH